MSAPTVSVITPTWQREHLLPRCRQQVEHQTCPDLEHIIVSDGPTTSDLVTMALPEHGGNAGSIAFLAGARASGGEWVFGLADDDLLVPSAVEQLLVAGEDGADFVYCSVAMIFGDDPMELRAARWICGDTPPRYCGISTLFARRELMDLAAPILREPERDPAHPCSDWRCVEAWLAAGKRWAFVPDVLVLHHVDH
ncbi:MAG: glycosyltransferase [Chloroflexota bacterium]|nr:glycosyltransferase [Chloroflexota bacterium]